MWTVRDAAGAPISGDVPSVTGDLVTTGDRVTLPLGAARGVALALTVNGGGDQTFVLEAQLPGSAWFGVSAAPNGAFPGSDYAYAPGDAIGWYETNPLLVLLPAGAVTVRARCTGGTTGSLTVILAATDAPGPLGIPTGGGYGAAAGPVFTVQDANGDSFPSGPRSTQPVGYHPNRSDAHSIDENPTLQGLTSNQFFAVTQESGGSFVGTYKFQGLYYGTDAYDLPVFDLDAHAWLAPGTVLSGPGRFMVGNDVASSWRDDPANPDSESVLVQALMLTHTGADLVVYFVENPFPQVYGAPGVPGPAVLTVQGDVGGTPIPIRTAAGTPTHINDAAAHNAIKTGAGTFERLIINTAAGAAATASIYDGLTSGGTLLATVDLTQTPRSLEYAIAFTVGLTIVTTGVSPADLTAVWT